MILYLIQDGCFNSHFHSSSLTVMVKCLKNVVQLFFGQKTIWRPVSFSRCKNGVGFRAVYDWSTQMKLTTDPNMKRSMIVLDKCRKYFSIKQIHNCTIDWVYTLTFAFKKNLLIFVFYNFKKKKSFSNVIWSSFVVDEGYRDFIVTERLM